MNSRRETLAYHPAHLGLGAVTQHRAAAGLAAGGAPRIPGVGGALLVNRRRRAAGMALVDFRRLGAGYVSRLGARTTCAGDVVCHLSRCARELDDRAQTDIRAIPDRDGGAAGLRASSSWLIDGWTGHSNSSPLRWLHILTGAPVWPLAAGHAGPLPRAHDENAAMLHDGPACALRITGTSSASSTARLRGDSDHACSACALGTLLTCRSSRHDYYRSSRRATACARSPSRRPRPHPRPPRASTGGQSSPRYQLELVPEETPDLNASLQAAGASSV